MVLVILAAVPVAVGVTVGLVARRWRARDPVGPAATATRAGEELREHVADAVGSLPGVEPSRPPRWLLMGTALAAATAAAAVGATVVGLLIVLLRRPGSLDAFDLRVATWAARNADATATALMRATTDLGASRVVVPLATVLAAIAVVRRREWPLAAFLGLLVLGQLALYNLLKVVIDRVRPDVDPLAGFAGPSFPSGHSTAAAACWAGFALVLMRWVPPGRRALVAGIGAGIGVYVAATRVLLGVHWPSDALAGVALGWSWFAVCCVLLGGRLLGDPPRGGGAGPHPRDGGLVSVERRREPGRPSDQHHPSREPR